MAPTDNTSDKIKTESFLDASEGDLLKMANLCMDRAGSALLTQPAQKPSIFGPDPPAEFDDFTRLRLFLEAQLCLSEAARKRADKHSRRIDRRDFWMELGVMLLIGAEIWLSIHYGRIAIREGKDQFKVLHNMETSTAATVT